MGITVPNDVTKCLYFTNRVLENDSWAKAWAYKGKCPECGKNALGKPLSKTGKPDKKNPNYECAECHHQLPNEEAEEFMQIEVIYKCPSCGKEGEATGPYKRKSFYGVKAFIVNCEHCDEKIGITKRLSAPKKKKK